MEIYTVRGKDPRKSSFDSHETYVDTYLHTNLHGKGARPKAATKANKTSGPRNGNMVFSVVKADGVVKGGRFAAHKVNSNKVSPPFRMRKKQARIASLSPPGHIGSINGKDVRDSPVVEIL